jgi:hypothetical protein
VAVVVKALRPAAPVHPEVILYLQAIPQLVAAVVVALTQQLMVFLVALVAAAQLVLV